MNVPEDLWNEMLRIISSLTPWHEMISEWAVSNWFCSKFRINRIPGIVFNFIPYFERG